ncbi:sulfite exporter TauE/SafE family protein, partial [Candidatus Woesearchaeota archaeon]|nr:sulfite exporter TauE/SafE family protein [Candidatus Woesearchaeota archaeon]
MVELTLFGAFAAGLASFLSPCVLPLVPAFVAYLSGTSAAEVKQDKARAKVAIFINTILFVAGFTLIFALLGALINSVLLNVSYTVKDVLAKAGGIIIILLGLVLLGVIKPAFLQQEHKLRLKGLKPSYLTSFLFGSAFAVGWTPCVGAILGAILTLALTQPSIAFWLLFAYGLGLGLPFIAVGLFTSRATELINKYQNVMKYVSIAAGIILIV